MEEQEKVEEQLQVKEEFTETQQIKVSEEEKEQNLKGQKQSFSKLKAFLLRKWMNLMRLHLVARQWEMRFWKRLYLNQFSYPASPNCLEKILHYLVPMDGETANGCVTGKICVEKKEQILFAIA